MIIASSMPASSPAPVSDDDGRPATIRGPGAAPPGRRSCSALMPRLCASPRRVRRVRDKGALALQVAAWVSVAVLIYCAGGPMRQTACGDCGAPIAWRSSLLYKLAHVVCSHLPHPLRAWAEVITMLGAIVAPPVLLFELAAKIKNWVGPSTEATEQWFWKEPVFLVASRPGGEHCRMSRHSPWNVPSASRSAISGGSLAPWLEQQLGCRFRYHSSECSLCWTTY